MVHVDVPLIGRKTEKATEPVGGVLFNVHVPVPVVLDVSLTRS